MGRRKKRWRCGAGREEALAHARAIVNATDLPVSARPGMRALASADLGCAHWPRRLSLRAQEILRRRQERYELIDRFKRLGATRTPDGARSAASITLITRPTILPPIGVFATAAFVAHHDAPLIGERAATGGRSATECGDACAGVKSAMPIRSSSLANRIERVKLPIILRRSPRYPPEFQFQTTRRLRASHQSRHLWIKLVAAWLSRRTGLALYPPETERWSRRRRAASRGSGHHDS